MTTGPRHTLPELVELQALQRLGGAALRERLLCTVPVRGAPSGGLPVCAYTLGSERPEAPALLVVGGVHGLERIGAEVAIAWLRSLVMRLAWDDTLHRQLDAVRLVFVPLLNPGGVWQGTRSNPRGVDLMRNAPVQAEDPVPWPLAGQRLSARLPWYRGRRGEAMEPEAQALCDLVETELLPRPFTLAVDCHSGFGLHDRLWFPFAHTARPIGHLPELHRLAEMLDQALLHHRYVMEPQSRQYRTHGDLWDHLYLRAGAAGPGHTFLPLTLEMGSWLWVKKNPRQLFSRHGIFNPLVDHRQRRVLRRHLGLLDFLGRAAASHARWLPQGPLREHHHQAAVRRWYGAPPVANA
ncbi:M14 family zinc carboxypeptidase [Ideonella sp.]|uniref:M14 family zinc carboxypeptidase n=1 Tax=Ideonella sp. TaxID=1929293 RepID=UPI0035ADAD0C